MAVASFTALTPQTVQVATQNVSTGATTIGSFTIPSLALSTALSSIRFQAWGVIANNANTKTLTLSRGSIFIQVNLIAGAAVPWVVDFFLTAQDPGGNFTIANQPYSGKVICGNTSASTSQPIGGVSALDFTASNTFLFTATGGATGDITCYGCVLLT